MFFFSLFLSGATNTGLQQTQQAAVPVHQHILSMATSPYGDNPIFKDLKPSGSLNEDALRPTNPAAQKAILESTTNQYKISPKISNGLKVKPVASTLSKVMLVFSRRKYQEKIFHQMNVFVWISFFFLFGAEITFWWSRGI